MRGKSAGGDDHHTGGVNTWLRGWKKWRGRKVKKEKKKRKEPEKNK